MGAGDFFTVIQFNETENILGNDDLMVRATEENKKVFEGYIDDLVPDGGTEFNNAFTLAYDTFHKSYHLDRSSRCHRAILFLTDGQLNDEPWILQANIQNQQNKFTEEGKNPPVYLLIALGMMLMMSYRRR